MDDIGDVDPHTRLVHERAIVTGAGSGIGRAVALRFAREGCSLLVLVDKEPSRLQAVEQEVGALGASVISRTLDLANEDEVTEFCGELPKFRPNILVSNAAAWCDTPFLATSYTTLNRIMAVNVATPYRLAQEAAKDMISESRAGSILFTGSISALGANRGFSAYCASKGAIVSMARSMAVELAEYGIRVNVVSPGTVDTAMPLEHVGAEALQRMRDGMPGVPIGRLADPSEVASVFAFLASSEASYISGHNLIVDGGLTAQVYDAPRS